MLPLPFGRPLDVPKLRGTHKTNSYLWPLCVMRSIFYLCRHHNGAAPPPSLPPCYGVLANWDVALPSEAALGNVSGALFACRLDAYVASGALQIPPGAGALSQPPPATVHSAANNGKELGSGRSGAGGRVPRPVSLLASTISSIKELSWVGFPSTTPSSVIGESDVGSGGGADGSARDPGIYGGDGEKLSRHEHWLGSPLPGLSRTEEGLASAFFEAFRAEALAFATRRAAEVRRRAVLHRNATNQQVRAKAI